MDQWITPQSLEARDVLTAALGRSDGAAAQILREWGAAYPWLVNTLNDHESAIRPIEWRWVPSEMGCLWPVAAFVVVGKNRGEAYGLAPDWSDMGRSWKVLPSRVYGERPMRCPL